jgi:hypothetical protein
MASTLLPEVTLRRQGGSLSHLRVQLGGRQGSDTQVRTKSPSCCCAQDTDKWLTES